MAGLFNDIFVTPLYNGFIFLISIAPGADVGLAIIVFTVLVRFILFPLSRKSVETQFMMREYDSEIQRIKERHKDDKRAQAEAVMQFYREKNLNPLSGFFFILIQIPIIFALYHIFLRSGLPTVDASVLYGPVQDFVGASITPAMHILGFFDLSEKSYILALLCGVSQFYQMQVALPKTTPKKSGATFADDLARSMNMQMKYVFPVVAGFIAYSLSGVVALYWTTSNLFSIGQELSIKRIRGKK